MSSEVLARLLQEDLDQWSKLLQYYEEKNGQLVVPFENNTTTLHHFNVELNNLYNQAYYDYARARRNKEAIERLLESVLKDYYKGPNPDARRAGGIQYARNYPAPDFYPTETVDLFWLEDQFRYIYYHMEATIKILQMKAEGKITNNSLLRIEQSIL